MMQDAQRAEVHRLPAVPALGVAALLLAIGCTTTSSSSSGSMSARSPDGLQHTAAVEHPALPNIPLPPGFKMVGERSMVRESGQSRYASCEYVGDESPDAVFRFYKEYMPSAGFKLRQWGLNRGIYTMEFAGSREQSTIRTLRDKFKTVLIIEVSPAPKGPVEGDGPTAVRRP
jgi:hypothetical protein